MDHYYTYASVDLPLKSLMEKEFNLPTLIENDATSACFGEHWLDLGEGYKNVLYMFSGVGCGMMINGELYRGSQGYAGEVSVYNYKEQDSLSCVDNEPCLVKRWDMDLGIVDDVKTALLNSRGQAEEFFRTTSTRAEDADLKSIFIAARSGSVIASAALEKAAKRLGIKIAYLVNLLNPQVVVIGGGLEESGEAFLNKVRSTVMDWAFREAASDLKIVYSQLRENAVAMGAASLVLERVFAQL
jgi:predicted NBD/HSP70 family sugar kinase